MSRLLVPAVLLLFCSFSGGRPARQLLPPMKGYVPVYIRNGDTPLEDINLDLAEAFHAIPSGRSARPAPGGRRTLDVYEKPKEVTETPKEKSLDKLDDPETATKGGDSPGQPFHSLSDNIQKIPKVNIE